MYPSKRALLTFVGLFGLVVLSVLAVVSVAEPTDVDSAPSE